MQKVDLSGQVALVTGAGRGIGRALSFALVQNGMAVALVARSAHEVAAVAHEIHQIGGRAVALQTDVTDRGGVFAVVAEVEKTLGPIDLLVNNAGVVEPIAPVTAVDVDDWWRAFEINMRGPLLCAQTVLNRMRARGRGRIVNMASAAGTMVWSNLSAYIVGKTALIRFTEQLALEVEDDGVSVFAVNPGAVRTELTGTMLESEAARRWIPTFRQRFEASEVSVELIERLIVDIASGRVDRLRGRFLSVSDDLDQLLFRVDEIERDSLYTLRVHKLSH